jgi:hypothetical protein
MRAHQIKSNVFLRLPFLNHKKILATINNRSHCQGTESRSILTPSILASIEKKIEIENDENNGKCSSPSAGECLKRKDGRRGIEDVG